MHITGQVGIELNGCGWHSVILDNALHIGYEEADLELNKLIDFQNKALSKARKKKNIRFMPSLSNIFGNTHLIQKKADNYLPFDYKSADCVRSYVEFINYLLHSSRERIKQITPIGKTTFLFPMTNYLFDDKQEQEIFFYLEKLKDSLEDKQLKALLEELIEYNKKELANL